MDIEDYRRNEMKSSQLEILFYPISEAAAEFTDPPIPASRSIPQWYKDLEKFSTEEKTPKYFAGASNDTVKSCLPVVDAFTSGYVFQLPCDIQVSKDDFGNTQINWSFKDSMVGLPSPVNYRPEKSEINGIKDKVCGWDNDEGYEPLSFNWFPYWCIKTPPGYSAIFTHPLNRTDLPFYTLGGIIDTDGWGEAGNHPFLIKKGWTGIIPMGTPIFQVIPFKRNSWRNRVDISMTKEHTKNIFNRYKTFRNYYKTKFWHSKDFK